MEKEQIIDKWLPIISDDYMHFTPDQFAYAKLFSMQCNIKDYDDRGVMMWATVKDIDSVMRTQVVLFYIKPEYRGTNLFLTMIKNLETIALFKQIRAIVDWIIGNLSQYHETVLYDVSPLSILRKNGYDIDKPKFH